MGSRRAGQEFTQPGIYCCPADHTAPFEHATRAFLRTRLSDAMFDDVPAGRACTQFLFRGHETVDGLRSRSFTEKSYGRSTQRIYHRDDAVIWKDLIVHIGAMPLYRARAATFVVPVYDPENPRESTRVYRAAAPYTGDDHWFDGAYVPLTGT